MSLAKRQAHLFLVAVGKWNVFLKCVIVWVVAPPEGLSNAGSSLSRPP